MNLDKKALKEVLSIPTAPYRERLVLEHLRKLLGEAGVPFFSDPQGNVVVGAKSEADYKRKIAAKIKEPVRLFIAHTDHPGFHGVKWENKKGKGPVLHFTWHGGSPTTSLEGAKVWVASPNGDCEEGKIFDVKLIKSKHAIESGKVKGLKALSGLPPDSLYGGFGFRKPVWSQGQVFYTKAADDLVGAFVIVSLAIELYRNRPQEAENFLGLLTRAEEVGFIGCLAHFELGWLKQSHRTVIGVSLETSRTLPGALVGKGPVVRLGDRASIFDARATEVLGQIAMAKLPKAHQRRIMDGGTCEGTVVTAYGLPCVAISIPLGNYHNQNFEGGPDARGPKGKAGPAPEFVHAKDIEGMAVLCSGLMESGLNWNSPWNKRQEGLRKRLKEAEPLLSSSF